MQQKLRPQKYYFQPKYIPKIFNITFSNMSSVLRICAFMLFDVH